MQTTCGHEPLYAKGMCRPCYDAAYREANRERRAVYRAAFREANRERIAAYDAAWYAANRARKAAYYAAWYAANLERQAAYREANRERRAATDAAWRAANPERMAAAAAAWRSAHPERKRLLENRRRTRKAGVVEIDRLDKALPCGVCGGFIDHTLPYPDPMGASIGHEPPLARQPAESITRYEHLRCNLAKGTKTDDELLERMAS